MIAIVAVDKNWGIGKDGEQLIYIPEDLKRFKAFTTGNTHADPVIGFYHTVVLYAAAYQTYHFLHILSSKNRNCYVSI